MRIRYLVLATLLALSLPAVALAEEAGAASATEATDAYYYFYEDEEGNIVQMDVDPSSLAPLGAAAEAEALGESLPLTYLQFNVTWHQDEARKCFELINDFRADASANWCWDRETGEKAPGYYRAPAIWDKELELDCMQRAYECAVIFGHVTPAKGYSHLVSPWRQSASENLCVTDCNAQWAFEEWKEEGATSASRQAHRMTMLYEGSTPTSDVYMGIACAEDANGCCYWVLHATSSLVESIEWQDDSSGISHGSRGPIQEYTNKTGSETVVVPVTDTGLVGGTVTLCSDFVLINGQGASAALPKLKCSDLEFELTDRSGRWWCTYEPFAAEAVGWEIDDTSIARIDGNKVVGVASSGITYMRTHAFGKDYSVPVVVARGGSASPFIDVKAPNANGRGGTSHHGDILWLYYSGVSTGWEVPAGREFRPFVNVARCDMAAFLYRLAGEPYFEPSEDDMDYFSDVTADTPHATEVWWLAHEGISAGWAEEDGTHTFHPYANVARCDMAAFLMRMATGDPDAESHYTPDPAYASYFSDINASSPHRAAVIWLASNGISKGWDVAGGRHQFRPYNKVVRSDMAAFLRRMDENGLV